MRATLRFLRAALKAIQLSLPKIGIGFMFALLTSNFNRITIHELGVLAVIVTSMIGLYHFLSPFQVIFGRMTDRHPILGFRRSPYLLIGLTISALVFPFLPNIAISMGQGSLLAILVGFILLIIFGLGLAMSGAAHLALIADTTSERERGMVVALVWTVQIASVIVSASVMKKIMPVYEPAAMQQMYNLVIPVVLISTLVALIGTERRLRADEARTITQAAREHTPTGNVITAPLALLRAHPAARNFFGFIIFSTLGVFIQDSILEVFGAEQLGMSVKETTSFQQVWGGGVLLSMLVIGAIIAIRPFSKRKLTITGSSLTALGLFLLTAVSLLGRRELMTPTLVLMGVGTGLYTTGTLSTMMELSTEGATATYMGLWGMAQALGNGLSSILAGSLHSALIDSHLLSASVGYGAIFALEACMMLAGAVLLTRVNVAAFRAGITVQDLTQTMEMGAA